MAFSSREAAWAVTLWIAYTHVFSSFDTSPRLLLTSAQKQSGKTRLLEVSEELVARPMRVTTPSPAVLFRSIEKQAPTILLDECDLYLGLGAVRESHDLRALINTGHRRGATIPRCVGQDNTIKQFPSFAPVAMAGIGEFPDTVIDRSVVIDMKRRRSGEPVERFRMSKEAPLLASIRQGLEAWAAEHGEELEGMVPVGMPTAQISDRAEELWEPLVVVADLAQGDWPARARRAAVALSGTGQAGPTQAVQLLGDIKALFDETGKPFLPTQTILDELEDRHPDRWKEVLTARKLSSMVRGFGAQPTTRPNGKRCKGYSRGAFDDAFSRYLPEVSSPVPSVPSAPGPATDVSKRLAGEPLAGASTRRVRKKSGAQARKRMDEETM